MQWTRVGAILVPLPEQRLRVAIVPEFVRITRSPATFAAAGLATPQNAEER
jgi:hypothetical protein